MIESTQHYKDLTKGDSTINYLGTRMTQVAELGGIPVFAEAPQRVQSPMHLIKTNVDGEHIVIGSWHFLTPQYDDLNHALKSYDFDEVPIHSIIRALQDVGECHLNDASSTHLYFTTPKHSNA